LTLHGQSYSIHLSAAESVVKFFLAGMDYRPRWALMFLIQLDANEAMSFCIFWE